MTMVDEVGEEATEADEDDADADAHGTGGATHAPSHTTPDPSNTQSPPPSSTPGRPQGEGAVKEDGERDSAAAPCWLKALDGELDPEPPVLSVGRGQAAPQPI